MSSFIDSLDLVLWKRKFMNVKSTKVLSVSELSMNNKLIGTAIAVFNCQIISNTISRHYSAEQLKELYKFAHEPAEKPQMAPPKDPILGEIIRGEKTKDWVCKYHQHDSLLEHRIVIINVAITKNKRIKFEIMVKTRRTTNS